MRAVAGNRIVVCYCSNTTTSSLRSGASTSISWSSNRRFSRIPRSLIEFTSLYWPCIMSNEINLRHCFFAIGWILYWLSMHGFILPVVTVNHDDSEWCREERETSALFVMPQSRTGTQQYQIEDKINCKKSRQYALLTIRLPFVCATTTFVRKIKINL